MGRPSAKWNWLTLQNHHKSSPKLTELLGVLEYLRPCTFCAFGTLVGRFLAESGELSAFFDVR